jgi:hypothetical protein
LTLENHTDPADASGEGGDDSGVIKALRKQVNDLQKELKSRPDRDVLLSEFQVEQARNSEIVDQLISLRHPKGMLDAVKGRIDGEADITQEVVAKALTDIGYQVEVGGDGSSQVDDSTQVQAELAGVADLSAQVQSAAGSGNPASILDRINQAESQAEIAKIAAEGGFLAG